MKKIYIVFCIYLIIISGLAFSSVSYAQITDPIPEKIEKSNLAIGFQEIVQIPKSGTGREKIARLNFLSHAGDGSGKLFVNDMRGKLYVIINGKASLYMNFKNIVCSGFSYDTSQQGFAYFAFHPQFAKNGIFYTVHSEEKNNQIPDFPVTKKIFDNKGNTIESSHHDVILEWKAANPTANNFTGKFREIMRIEQPYEDHNTGQLGFNPNAKPGDSDYGMLYIALADGMKVDVKGNLYSSGSGGVWIFSPTGQLLGKIAVPESVTNLAWGNKDYKTLYITAGKSIYRITLNIAGIQPGR